MPFQRSVLWLLLWCAGCCTTSEETLCLELAEDEQAEACPNRAEAADELGAERVVGEATFWPARTYTIDGDPVVRPAQCCYAAEIETCTSELH